MEHKQERLLSFLEKAVQNPDFVEHLDRKLDTMDFSAYNKKRRLPLADHVQLNVSLDNRSSSRPISHQDIDLCGKLRLELSPSVSDVNLLSHSTQSSNEDLRVRTAGLELSDTGASFTLKMDSSLPCKAGPEGPKPHFLHRNSLTLDNDEGEDGHLSCLLNLSLASSPLELNKSWNYVGGPLLSGSRPNDENNEGGDRGPSKERTLCVDDDDDDDARDLSSTIDVHNKKQGPARVNDVFWEQFLTERPGCADTEEASSRSV